MILLPVAFLEKFKWCEPMTFFSHLFKWRVLQLLPRLMLSVTFVLFFATVLLILLLLAMSDPLEVM
jgi:hypothetical protein